ncbi:TetR/AcrR family transcriptional regulator [Spirosoma sp.]|uniref:TetR/AcrR family transcriptional regulator n=1 Tax=Spirosoma sp. TaxID=1899569 RepID=UPI003B3BE2FA
MQRILQALEHILTQQGLQGLSIQALAQQADVSIVLIYRYFGSVEGLIDYYLRQGRIVPHFPPDWLALLQPIHPPQPSSSRAHQTLQLFRQFRSSRAAREMLLASAKEKDELAQTISKALDEELTGFVSQLAGASSQRGLWAVVLGALSYLTIQAQLDRSVLGLDLRSEGGWQQIEQAIESLHQVLAESGSSSGEATARSGGPSAVGW